MCVIFVAEDARPSREMLTLGKAQNPHATGIAWRAPHPEDPNKIVVHWRKGNDIPLEEVVELAETLPTPYVIHFRNPSNGTGQRDGCAHPFPLDPKVPLFTEGNIAGSVLFHNGFWTRWKDNLIEAAIRSRKKLPTDPWSDSRGLAWMAYHFGHGILELIDEKVVVLGTTNIEIYGSRDWKRINGVLCSNDHWQRTVSDNLPAHYRGSNRHMGGHGAVHGSFANQNRGASSQNQPAHETTNNTNAGGGEQANAGTGGSSHVTPFRGAANPPAQEGTAEGASGSPVEEAVQETVAGSGTTNRGSGWPAQASEASAWARGINAKQFRRPSNSAFERPLCAGTCGKHNAFISTEGKDYCFDCWDARFGIGSNSERGADVASRLYLEAKCEHCRLRSAQSITISTKKWICGTCWHEQKRPDVRRIMRTGNKANDQRRVNEAKGIETRAVM